MDSGDSSYDSSEEDITVLQAAGAVAAAATAVVVYATPLYEKVPYHTSALSGIDWVRELLNGHPERIRNELGVHKHVFAALIVALRQGGITASKHVLLEEKLAMFLYTCVTGLSIRHVCERFQRATETTSRYVLSNFLISVE